MKKGILVVALMALVLGSLGAALSSEGPGLTEAQRIQLIERAERVLTDGLFARSVRTRTAAAWALGRVPSSEAPSLLIQALSEERSWSVRVAAARALAALQTPSAVFELALALREAPDELTRRAFRDALIAIGEPSVPALIGLLQDPADAVRRSAAWALGRIGSAEALPPLVRALDPRLEGSPAVRRQAAQSLGELGSPEAVPALLDALASDPDPMVRLLIVGALGTLGDPRALSPLSEILLQGDDFLLRAEAALALGKLRGAEAESLPVLFAALERETRGLVRSALALGLGETRRPEAVPALIDLLLGEAEPESVQRSAASGLATIGSPEALGMLREALAAPRGEVRLAAAFALGAAGDPSALAELTAAALQDPDPEDRARAAQLLGSLGDPTAVEPLARVLRGDRYASVRRIVAEALAALGERTAVPALIEALRQDSSRTVRAAAAEALGALGDPRAVSALREALETAPEAGPILEDAFAGRLARALAGLGQVSLPTLTELLEAESETVRRAAAYGLELLARRAAEQNNSALAEGLAEALPLLHEKLLTDRIGPEQIDAACALWAILQL